ncbi:hypothetical protein MKK88_01225 [Methylobacterium sp. E-005]|uniref:hypothetical protein n=1 Tax=Methylobacterium sp. E-005 TaxID=2836549 RepID=UPI001FB92E47|nr:hypothetical protein [Methylobacterium sp. E-005]MCJ2084618.1 hypothetical protein [Methylobacterium sp. E-005]
MYDIDPPSPILRLNAPRKGDGGTVLNPEPAAPIPFPAQLDRYLAKRDADAAILRVKALRKADESLARWIDRL